MKHKTLKITLMILIIILLAGIFVLSKKTIAWELESLQEGSEDFSTQTISTNRTFSSYADDVLKFGIVLGGILAVIAITVGGFEYIMAGGNTGTIEKAKNRIWQAIIGLLVVAGSWLILYTVNPDLVNLGLGITNIENNTSSTNTEISCGYCYKIDSTGTKCEYDDSCIGY